MCAQQANPPVLSCWKDIAHFLGKGVRTAQRWEKELGLPVHRLNGGRKSAVIADPREVEAWLTAHPLGKSHDPPVTVSELVLQSQLLRSAHAQLMNAASTELAALKASCREMAETRRKRAAATISPRQ